MLVNHVSGYIEEKNGNKDLILDEKKEVFKKNADVWNGLKNKNQNNKWCLGKWLRKKLHEN